MWSNYARVWFEREFVNRDGSLSVSTSRWPRNGPRRCTCGTAYSGQSSKGLARAGSASARRSRRTFVASPSRCARGATPLSTSGPSTTARLAAFRVHARPRLGLRHPPRARRDRTAPPRGALGPQPRGGPVASQPRATERLSRTRRASSSPRSVPRPIQARGDESVVAAGRWGLVRRDQGQLGIELQRQPRPRVGPGQLDEARPAAENSVLAASIFGPSPVRFALLAHRSDGPDRAVERGTSSAAASPSACSRARPSSSWPIVPPSMTMPL